MENVLLVRLRLVISFASKMQCSDGNEALLATRLYSSKTAYLYLHIARVKQCLQQHQETPQFICPYLWPPNSLDLNPVDYKIL